MNPMECRFCNAALKHTFVNLGGAPPTDQYLRENELYKKITLCPMHLFVCDVCLLVQLPVVFEPRELFNNYVCPTSSFMPYSNHYGAYAEHLIELYGLNGGSCIVEVAGPNEHLLGKFQDRGISVLGIGHNSNIIEKFEAMSIPAVAKAFNRRTASELGHDGIMADLLITNQALSHSPNLHDFFSAVKSVLKPTGVFVLEVSYLSGIIRNNRFDMFDPDCLSYFTLNTLDDIVSTHGLEIFDAEDVRSQGRILRIYAHHVKNQSHIVSNRLRCLKENEIKWELTELDSYLNFFQNLKQIKRKLLCLLFKIKERGQTIACYGLSGRGNTFLNYCGIGSDIIDYTVDLNPAKQQHFLAGTNIPVFHPDKIAETKPDFVLILPLGGREELIEQLSFVREWGGKFIVPGLEVEILS